MTPTPKPGRGQLSGVPARVPLSPEERLRVFEIQVSLHAIKVCPSCATERPIEMYADETRFGFEDCAICRWERRRQAAVLRAESRSSVKPKKRRRMLDWYDDVADA